MLTMLPWKKCLDISLYEAPHNRFQCLKTYLDDKSVYSWTKKVQARFFIELGNALSVQQILGDSLQYLFEAQKIIDVELSKKQSLEERTELEKLNANLSINIAQDYFELRRLDEVREYTKKALTLFENHSDNSGIAKCYDSL
ncbi:MAG: hypothetical protein ACXAC7_10475, partial [Candidatus Hodarchaeales archaeon]